MLSYGARRLYERLLELGPVGWGSAPLKDGRDHRLDELASLGLVEIHAEYVTVVPAREARSKVTSILGAQCRDLLNDMGSIEEFIRRCQPHDHPLRASGVEIISGSNEVALLSGEVVHSTERELTSVNTLEHRPADKLRFMGPTSVAPLSHLRYRIIYSADYLSDREMRHGIEQAVEGGEEARIHPAPPLKFKIADRNTVLVPLDKSGASGALLIKTPALCGLFVDYFEKLWAESTPFDASRTKVPGLLNPLQTRILGLIADDAPDLAIARKLDISERTVRRHVGIILDKLGARTRAGAVVMALERGLLSRQANP